jgi:hypothetical protein
MTTGKVENEAAIKLLDEMLALPLVEETPEMRAFRDRVSGKTDAEHERLRSAVVEAAKEFWEFGSELYEAKIDAAVEQLIEFEEHNQ